MPSTLPYFDDRPDGKLVLSSCFSIEPIALIDEKGHALMFVKVVWPILISLQAVY